MTRRLEAIWTLGGLSRFSVPRSYPIAQAPNLPLLVAAIGLGGAAVLDGGAAAAAKAAGLVALAVWAGAEIGWGANAYRRALGLAVLVLLAVRLV